MNKIREAAFAAVCLMFSLAFLIMALLTGVELARLNERAAQAEKECIRLESENRVLEAELISSLSLSELEEYATEKLGMQRCLPGQIVYIEYTG